MPSKTPLWLSARHRRESLDARTHAKARIRFFALLLTGCFSSLLLVVIIALARADYPPDARTATEWESRLRSPDVATRADAVEDLSHVAAVPVLPCAILVERLSDVAAVRVPAVASLTRIVSRGRCADEVLDLQRRAPDPRSRAAASRVLGAAASPR